MQGMGQMCSYCPLVRCCCCCCAKRVNKRRRTTKTWKEDSNVTPSDIRDSQLASVYTVPGSNYNNADDVFELRGYDFKNKEQIARGGFATVFKINNFKTKTVCAVKQIPLKGFETKRDPKKYENLKSEVFVISKIKHKNIVQLFDHFIINNVSYLVMEFANSGTVDEEVHKFGAMSEMNAKKYFYQITTAIAYLHNRSPPIAHRDLKLANILIQIENKEKILKITDFGFSRVMSEKTDKKLFRAKIAEGTPPYMSPQLLKLVLNDTVLDHKQRKEMRKLIIPRTVNPIKADIWALGVCLYVMVTAKYPYPYNKDVIKVVMAMEDGLIKPIDKKISTHLLNLLNEMLKPKTDLRIDINGVVEHQWLRGVPHIIFIKDS